MALPFFYIEDINATQKIVVLNEETSKHVVQVLRMKNDELLLLTNGKGGLFTGKIIDDHRKKCVVEIVDKSQTESPVKKVTIAISLVKNNTRFEWFLEKATEIGVSAIVPLICERTEKQHFRQDRMQGILTSAMLQSQQSWMPELTEPTKYANFVKNNTIATSFIAHCIQDKKEELADRLKNNSLPQTLILIGPEGDFSQDEIALALQHNFMPVSLGATRLRTETAGMVAATMLCNL